MALDKKTEEIMWKINIGDNVFNLLMEGSRLYVDSGSLFVIETENELADSTRPLWRADEGITERVRDIRWLFVRITSGLEVERPGIL
ncbi:MAG: hypothetical protein J7L52_09120 [Thermotogae bacterium]|nr:hypothetical protein [Thermotogota bacterium]